MDKYKEVKRVLFITLILNLSVALIKLSIGYFFRLGTLIADGLHSSSDSLVNIIGLVSMKWARKKSDKNHPYGYEKYETIATFIVVILIFFMGFETFQLGVKSIIHPYENLTLPTTIVYFSVIFTILINIITVIYEGRKGKKLNSEFLIVDSNETKWDILISSIILFSLFFVKYPQLYLNGIIQIFISILIFRAAYQMFKEVSDILTDKNIIDPKVIYDIVMVDPDVKFCHAIRSRGKENSIFIDFHLGVNDDMDIKKAHNVISHNAKRRIFESIEGVKSVNIHIEPESSVNRPKSINISAGDDYDQILPVEIE